MLVARSTHQAFRICLLLVSLSFAFGQNAHNERDAIASALRNNEFEKALELLQPALAQSPGDAQLWTMQGVAYSGDARKQEALGSFNRALKLSPDYLPALTGAIQIEFDSGNPDAMRLLRRV